MGAYSKFKAARATGGAYNYLTEGHHLVRIESCKFDETRKGIEFFATEVTVLETNADPSLVGQRRNWMTTSDKDAFEGNVKQFFCAVWGLTEEEVDALPEEQFEEFMDLMVGKAQAASGRVCTVDVVEKLSKAGNKYNAARWTPGPAEQQPDFQKKD
jgi:hypothetical protein